MANGLPEELAVALAARRQGEFAAGARRLAAVVKGAADPGMTIRAAVVALADGGHLPSELARRVAFLLRTIQSSRPLTREVVKALSDLPLPLRSGVAPSIPPELLPELYGGEGVMPVTPQLSRVEPERGLGPVSVATPEGDNSSRGSAVVLLSAEDNQESNQALLSRDGFEAYRVDSLEVLAEYLETPDVCGFIIDGSFWRSLAQEQHVEALATVATFSSLTCIFIDRTDFAEQDAIRRVIAEQRPTPPTYL